MTLPKSKVHACDYHFLVCHSCILIEYAYDERNELIHLVRTEAFRKLRRPYARICATGP